MLKIDYQTLNGDRNTKEFKDVAEFIMLQNREIPALEDSYKVTKVLINEKPYPFNGNIEELFFKLENN